MKDYFYSQCLFILCSFFISFHGPEFFVLYYLSGEGGASSGHLSLIENIKMIGWGSSLVVPWLRLYTSTAGGLCSISGQGTKILHALWYGQKIKIKEIVGQKIQEILAILWFLSQKYLLVCVRQSGQNLRRLCANSAKSLIDLWTVCSMPCSRRSGRRQQLEDWKDFAESTAAAAAVAKSLQLCSTLCDPMDCSPPGPSVHGIFQARVLEWGAIAFSGRKYSSVTQSCLTLCDPMNRRTPGLPVHHQLPEFTQTLVHWVSDAIHLIFCCPLLLLPPIPPSIRVFSNESTLHTNRWGNSGNCVRLYLGAPKLLQMVTAAMKLKDTYSLEGKLWPT